MADLELNPLDAQQSLKPSVVSEVTQDAHPQAEILPGDSAVTKAEKVERHGEVASDDLDGPPSKRQKRGQDPTPASATNVRDNRSNGAAPIRAEYLLEVSRPSTDRRENRQEHDDDAAEASGKADSRDSTAGGRGPKKNKGGQNKARTFGSSRDAIQLCKSRARVNEFAPAACKFPKCRFEHDLRVYLKDGKREDLDTFNGKCPIFEARGRCNAGWQCRFVGSHSKEVEHDDGRKELVLTEQDGIEAQEDDDGIAAIGVVNMVPLADKILLRRKKYPTEKSDAYLKWQDKENQENDKRHHAVGSAPKPEVDSDGIPIAVPAAEANTTTLDRRAEYIEPPFRASEKRRIYYGPDTPVLAPLTTQGNLPFRRLCVSLGAEITWSEMAMGLPLIGGEKGEWALIKAHESEMTPPAYSPKTIVHDYNNSKDVKFGVQIAANKPWLALKTTEVLTDLCPNLRAIDLNCGCPIELVCRTGGGSALLDAQAKLEKTLRGMNAVSGSTPITVKIRMGTKDKQPTAEKLIQRLILGGQDAQSNGEDPSGVAAITLHGRSKAQRYSRVANWEYISECATLVRNLKAQRASLVDTTREPDARDLANGSSSDGLPYFCGNGDVLSHIDYNTHIQDAGVDSCMIGRGALIKPWLFEEIATNQYLDKSATERLAYIEAFARNGLEYWGSDEIGVGTTRRFLLEWLSFSCRYVPIGLLEHLPPKINERPPAYKGRNELETLLASSNYKDWIKISEMFLGKATDGFQFQPKHKSNSYEIEAEG